MSISIDTIVHSGEGLLTRATGSREMLNASPQYLAGFVLLTFVVIINLISESETYEIQGRICFVVQECVIVLMNSAQKG